MSKLQAQFTKYMEIALKNDSIDYFRAIKNNWKTKDVKYVNIEDYEALVSQECDTETSFFDENYFDDITDKELSLEINNLTKLQKETLYLYVKGESEKNIAKKFNVRLGTIKATIFQIKQKLKKYRKES